MKAIAVYQHLATDDPDCFEVVEIPKPQAKGKDLLVQVKAVGVNPIDYKVRSAIKDKLATPKILGWDAVGIVTEVGENTSLFQIGDQVYYAGSITRPGCNCQYQLVDERIVGRKPCNLSFEEAAALPLTTITAWEALFERLAIKPTKTDDNLNSKLLIINGAGGVGSIAIQLAKQIAGVEVIATASRGDTVRWCRQLGADHCINHHEKLLSGLAKLGIDGVDYILCLNDTDQHWQNMAEVIKPQGKICSIVGNQSPLDLNILKSKSVTFAWEFMFTKSQYNTSDIASQGELLNRVSRLIEIGVIKTTFKENLGILNPANMAIAHSKLASGKTIGKLVLMGM
ncbi:putative oxidoreductase [Chondrocystis sp. NIES-4102]|nr:putative oxidoreductase [Chondrocystis sp. NIES-4102]